MSGIRRCPAVTSCVHVVIEHLWRLSYAVPSLALPCYLRCFFFLPLPHHIHPTTFIPILSQRLPGESWQHEARLVDILVIVPTQLLLFLLRPTPQRCLEISFCVLAADHKSDLAGWVSGDGSVGIVDSGEDFLARGLEGSDEREVKPLVLRYKWCVSVRTGWTQEDGQPWVVITPPSLSAPCNSSKYGF